MIVVLDTNVWVAGFVSRAGLCASVVEACLERHRLVTSEYILDEMSRNLATKIRLPKAAVHEMIVFVRGQATVIVPDPVDLPTFKDQTDLPVIGTAVAGQADRLVTGDRALLGLVAFGGTQIVSPRTFWDTSR